MNPHIFADKLPQVKVETETDTGGLRREKALQAQIVSLLRLKGIEPLWHRTDKKSAATVGWPDITFSVEHGLRSIPCLWEIKLPGKKLSLDQQTLMIRLMEPPNAWAYRVITSVDEALMELRKLGID